MFRESEEFYHNLIAQVKDYAIFTTDPRGVITTWNEGCKNLLGYDRDEFIGQHIMMVFPPETVASGAADKEMETAAEKGSASDDRWLIRKGGERFWASGITTGVRNETGNLVGFTKVLRDLTERREYEERLHERQLFFRMLAESLPQLVWTCRGDGECDYVSPQWVNYTGVPETEQFGYGWLNQLHPEDREQAIADWKRAVKAKDVFDVEYRIRGADGVYRWFKTRALPLHRADGKIVKWFGTSTDIEDQKAIEASLRLSEERLRAERDFSDKTVDSLPGVFYLFDEQGKFLRWNKNLEEVTGYTAEEIVGMSPLEFIPEADRTAVDGKFRDVFVHGEANIEVRLMTKSGRSIPYLFRGSRILIDGRPCLLGNGVDISVIKQGEEAAAYLAAIVESSDDAIIGADLNGKINSWNKGAERLYGYTAAETIGNPVTMLLPPLRMDEEPRILELLRRGERIDHYETVRRRKDGTDVDVSLTVSPIQNRAGEIIGASKTARDITERKRAEEERDQYLSREREARSEAEAANRLKDEFLATVSHEVRSHLTVMAGSAEPRAKTNPREPQPEHRLHIIELNAQAQARLIEDLLDVSRIVSGKLSVQTRPVHLNQTIEGVIAGIRPSAEAKGIDLSLKQSGDEISIIGDADRLQQVVWNLLSNSIKFTPDGGRIDVRVESVGQHVELRVSDTGRGISPEFLPHVFDRFRQAYRTDAGARAGLGLGLTIVRYIVEAHGGTVTAESPGVGQGATVTIILPMAPASPAPIPAIERQQLRIKAAELPSLDGLRVLVVDDDEDARDVLSAVLENYGAAVITAPNATHALDILAAEKFDVLVSDINMPMMDGYELIRRVRSMKPEHGGRIPAVALTAYARAEDRVQALQAGYQMHVPKPIEPSELEVVVATLAKSFK